MRPIQQGNVILIYAAPVNAADRPLEKLLQERQVLPLILAGEATEPSHQVAAGEAELYQEDGICYLQVCSETARLIHQQHGSIDVPQGIWLVHHRK